MLETQARLINYFPKGGLKGGLKMSCTFWLRRKKVAAMRREQERQEAEKQAEMERQRAEAAQRAAERRAAKKAVVNDDKA